MATIEIEWLSDSYDCDDCGTSWSDGATVDIDGKRILSLVPSAHCFGGEHYSAQDVYEKIIDYFGAAHPPEVTYFETADFAQWMKPLGYDVSEGHE